MYVDKYVCIRILLISFLSYKDEQERLLGNYMFTFSLPKIFKINTCRRGHKIGNGKKRIPSSTGWVESASCSKEQGGSVKICLPVLCVKTQYGFVSNLDRLRNWVLKKRVSVIYVNEPQERLSWLSCLSVHPCLCDSLKIPSFSPFIRTSFIGGFVLLNTRREKTFRFRVSHIKTKRNRPVLISSYSTVSWCRFTCGVWTRSVTPPN